MSTLVTSPGFNPYSLSPAESHEATSSTVSPGFVKICQLGSAGIPLRYAASIDALSSTWLLFL